MKILKKHNQIEDFNFEKIKNAVTIAAKRSGKDVTEDIINFLFDKFSQLEREFDVISIKEVHSVVQYCLMQMDKDIHLEYCKYQDYKKNFPIAFNEMLLETKRITFEGDRENANKNSALNSTIKENLGGLVSEQIMMNYEYKPYVKEAHLNNKIYIHDARDRVIFNINCCLFDLANVLKDGFYLNGIEIEEPDTFETAIDLTNDIIMCASSQQYGGLTIPEIDKTLGYYVKKTVEKMRREMPHLSKNGALMQIQPKLKKKLRMLEYKINSVNNANGQTAFVTFSFGHETDEYSRLVSKTILDVRREKLGKNKITAVFPKLVFLHRNGVNGKEGDINYDLKQLAMKCSIENLYPDYLSLDAGYLGEVYDRCGKIISPMGCRAYLSPYVNENGEEIYLGRFNIGAITLILPSIALEAGGDENKFFELLDKYQEIAAKTHEFTYKKMAKKKASSNPLFFCEGGAWIKLKPEETIEKALESATASFGYIGLEECVYALTGKHLEENPEVGEKILNRINENSEYYKKKYNRLFAVYATPSEGLCDKALMKDRNKYGIIKGVTDKRWYTNSYHTRVELGIPALDKLELENRFFHKSTGGRIVYTEFPHHKNLVAVEQVINEAMKKGFYFGYNCTNSTCKDCGNTYDGQENEKCPQCGSNKRTTISRVCGYLGVEEDVNSSGETESRYNDGKREECNNRHDHYGINFL